MTIRQLEPDVAAKIAAGEVVERPASVVKELIENSIDAGATQIRVELANGGLQLIRIMDNGSGIPADELPLALARHATSKVAQIADLEQIRSLGFRGEALASIAAVAEVTLLSRVSASEQGSQIVAQNSWISGVTTAASAVGTTITVRNLFSSVPARLKFLKSRTTEVSYCHHLLQQYALAYPEIRFSVLSEGRQIFATPGDGKLKSVLVAVYGLQIAEQMVPMSNIEQFANGEQTSDPERPLVTGYVSRPSCYKSTRQYLSFFVNRRWVMSRMLTAAAEGAYHSLLLSGRHPIVVINIQIDPALLDVNVHPAKTEIRFLKERRIFSAIIKATRQALVEEPVMPQWQPMANGHHNEVITNAEYNEPSLLRTIEGNERDRICSLSGDESDNNNEYDRMKSEANDESNEEPLPADNPWITMNEEETGTKPPMLSRLWQSHIRSAATSQAMPKNGTPSATAIQTPLPEITANPSFPDTQIPPFLQRTSGDWDVRTRATGARPEGWDAGQLSVFQGGRLPHLRVVGQVAQSYIVTEGEDGSMYLIDQHAAHERIVLERMVAAMKAREAFSQLLLTPIELELAPSELQALEEHQGQLESLGFSLLFTEAGTVEIRAVPSALVKQMNVRSLHELLIDLTTEGSHIETWEERALANVACKAAIKANYFLTLSEMRELLEQLEHTKAPYSCCHGRPTMVHVSPSALAHAFDRR